MITYRRSVRGAHEGIMRLVIAAVGKLKEAADRDLCERYAKRFSQTGRAVGLGPLRNYAELMEGRQPTAEGRKNDEAERILRIAGKADLIIALDVTGRQLTSEAFAELLAKERDGGAKQPFS